MRFLEEMLEELEAVAAAQGAIIYNIAKRRAGWGVEWWEEGRCTTPEPQTIAAGHYREYAAEMASRLSEGRVTYLYRPTLRAAVEAELERLTVASSTDRAAEPTPTGTPSGG